MPKKFRKKAVRAKRTREALVGFSRLFIDGKEAPEAILDAKRLYESLQNLPFDETAAESRYYENADGQKFVGELTMVGSTLRFRMGKQSPRPHYEMKGEFKTADEPEAGSHWISPAFVVFFPSKGVVGSILSRGGPSMSDVCRYLEECAKYGQELETRYLTNPNIREQLKRFSGIRRFVVRYRSSSTPSLFAATRTDIDGVMGAYSDLHDDAEITLQVKSRIKGGGFLRGVKDAIASALETGTPNLDVEEFRVWGPTSSSGKKKDRISELNLLESRLAFKVPVTLEENGKEYVELDAYRAIEGAYAEHLTQFPSYNVIEDE